MLPSSDVPLLSMDIDFLSIKIDFYPEYMSKKTFKFEHYFELVKLGDKLHRTLDIDNNQALLLYHIDGFTL